MTTQPEIKAGQRWKFPGHKVKQWDGSSVIAEVKLIDDSFVYLRGAKKHEAFTVELNYFIEHYEPVPEPKTRPITKDDVLKMLAVNPHLFMRPINKCGTIAFWSSTNNPVVWLENTKNNLSGYQYSHNPFAPNPVVVGPMVVDEVGE